MTRRHFIISGANDVHLPGPSSSLRLLPANNSSFFTMFAFTCVPSITLSTISVNLFKCHLDTEWFLFIYHIYCVYYILFNLFKCHLGTEWLLIYYSVYSNVTLIQSGSYLYIIYCYMLYIIQFISISLWYRVVPIFISYIFIF